MKLLAARMVLFSCLLLPIPTWGQTSPDDPVLNLLNQNRKEPLQANAVRLVRFESFPEVVAVGPVVYDAGTPLEKICYDYQLSSPLEATMALFRERNWSRLEPEARRTLALDWTTKVLL